MKKFISLLLCLALALAFTACGPNKKPTPGGGDADGGADVKLMSKEEAQAEGLLSGKLIIKAMSKGYGTQFLDKMAENYMAENPNATVEVKPAPDISGTVGRELPTGPEGNDTDIYFGAGINYAIDYTDENGADYDSISQYLDLTDFLDNWYSFDDEDTMRNIIDADLIDMLSIESKSAKGTKRTFALPWAGSACGLVYRTDIFEEVFGKNYELPATTDDLLSACDDILAYNEAHKSEKGFQPIWPIVYGGNNSVAYWEYLTYSWWAQYEGHDMFMKYWTLADDDPFLPNAEYYHQNGQLEAAKVSEKLIQGKYVYAPSKGMKDETAENLFFNGKDGYRFAMTPNGDWFENEVSGRVFAGGDATTNFAMMPTPVLSAAVQKHGGIENVEKFAFTLASTHNVFIPCYSKEKYLALDFLSYYYSVDGAKTFFEETRSILPRADYTYLNGPALDSMSPFTKSLVEIVDSTKFVYTGLFLSPLRYMGSMPVTPENMGSLEKEMLDGDTAQEAYNRYIAYFDKNWAKFCDKAGAEY